MSDPESRHGEGGIYPGSLQYVSDGAAGFGFATGGGAGSACGAGHQTSHGALSTMDQYVAAATTPHPHHHLQYTNECIHTYHIHSCAYFTLSH